MQLERWQRSWRHGFQPQLTTETLRKLRSALEGDGGEVVHGMTYMTDGYDGPIRACCPVAFCGWQGIGIRTGTGIDHWFSRLYMEADERLRGNCVTSADFIRWWDDDAPSATKRKALAEEITIELEERDAYRD